MILASLSSPVSAADAGFPNHPVRIIVTTSPGGGTDLLARVMAQRLSEHWGQPVVVDNRAGATGLIGLEILARAAPDGYTLSFSINPSTVVPLHQSRSLSLNRDFTPIALSAATENMLVVHPSVPAKSVTELVELARAKPRSLNYASGGEGSVPHLGMALFSSMVGIDMAHVPYKGSGQAAIGLVSGQVQLALASVSSLLTFLQSGRVRGLAVTGAKRSPAAPEIPTFTEAGFPKYQLSVWYGVFGPAHMPANLVARLNADSNWVINQPDVQERLVRAGLEPKGGLSPAQFAKYVNTNLVTWNDAMKAAGIR